MFRGIGLTDLWRSMAPTRGCGGCSPRGSSLRCSMASFLREIVTGLGSHSARLYHLGADPVRRSTLSDANAQRPVAVFSELLAMMMKQAHRGLRRKLGETTYLIDATSIRLNEHSAGWARFSTGVCGAKVHVIYDADADRPIYAAVSAANVNDITVAQQM